MIQNFNVQGGPQYGQKNLPLLRASLKSNQLDGFLVPHEDEYNNEYLPDCNERLMWVSGFTGSAGAAIILSDQATMFVDGRYTLQVTAQVDAKLFKYLRLENSGQAEYLASLPSGLKIGYDPKLHSPDALARLQTACAQSGNQLLPVSQNLIDQIWQDRPAAPKAKIIVHPIDLSGEDHGHKRARIGKHIADQGADCALITSPASIAWLLNVRGADVMCTPLPLSTLLIRADGRCDWFVDPDKISAEIQTHIGNEVSISDDQALDGHFQSLAGQIVLIDPSTASSYMFEQVHAAGAKVKRAMDPIALPKACKNHAEIAGTTQAHIRDGVAMAKFLHWLDTEAQNGKYDEISAAQTLENFRAESGQLKDLSFESISGAGSNGAIVHYRVSTATVKKLAKGSLYLIDSGAQYPDGTTDITRTLAIGTPTAEMKKCFTLVLKGHIALSKVRFPAGTTGHALDVLARAALWANGLDYDHGTGHGVGAYLGVHEGPQRIAKSPSAVPLQSGMIVSNEPGYYKTGGFGIRIENLQYVTPEAKINGGERPMLGFHTLTLAPISHTLVDTTLLSGDEIEWLNAYHQQVKTTIAPLLDATKNADVISWLKQACEAL